MTNHYDPDDILGAWFDEGPRDLPWSTRRAIATSLPTSKQTRRGLLALWRFRFMPFPMRPALGVAAVVIAVAGTAVFLRPPSDTGTLAVVPSLQPTSPPPSANAEARGSQAPTSWPRYTSDQYGFTIGHPSDWIVRKAFRPWSFQEDATDAQHSGGAEGFLSGDEYLYVNAWMAPLADGQSGLEWLGALCPTCAAESVVTRPIEVDGQQGTLILGDETIAYVTIENKVYAFAVWRRGYDALLEEFLSTVELP